MSTTTQTLTLAEVFERLGLDPSQVIDGRDASGSTMADSPRTMAAEVESYKWCSTSGTGALQVTCGGECLVAIKWSPRGPQFIRTTQRAYIVRDETALRNWRWAREHTYDGSPSKTVAALGPCPHAIIKFVQSA